MTLHPHKLIQTIETLSFRALPALEQRDYDGWIMRYANGRGNAGDSKSATVNSNPISDSDTCRDGIRPLQLLLSNGSPDLIPSFCWLDTERGDYVIRPLSQLDGGVAHKAGLLIPLFGFFNII